MSGVERPAGTHVVIAQFGMSMESRADSVPVLRAKVPVSRERLLCLMVQTGVQEDRLGDFEELYSKIWLPKFGPAICVAPLLLELVATMPHRRLDN
jgi:hypothetical protein